MNKPGQEYIWAFSYKPLLSKDQILKNFDKILIFIFTAEQEQIKYTCNPTVLPVKTNLSIYTVKFSISYAYPAEISDKDKKENH